MRVLIASPGQDTGGMGIRIKRAIEKFSDRWEARALRASENFIEYPADLESYRVPRSTIQQIYDRADVIHCSNSMEPVRRYGHGHKKPAIVTYQGTAFRTSPEQHIREAHRYRAIQSVSTLDLTTLSDEVRWSPHPIDIPAMAANRVHRDDGLIVIHHSPTNRRVKSTAIFLEAMDRLMREDPRVRVQLVEGKSWRENLALKGRADILYDQIILGWGTNALEAWAMGLPVVAATEFPKVRERMLETLGEIPSMEATAETLYDALRTLVNEPEVRAEYAARGQRYVTRWHDEETVAERLTGWYDEAVERWRAAA